MSPTKVAIVTGANKGIGLECVKQLAATGSFSTVYLAARDVSRGEAAVASLTSQKALEPFVKFLQLDLNSSDGIAATTSFVATHQPEGIDVLINNAGVCCHPGETTPSLQEQAQICHDVHYYGTRMVTEAFLPLMKPGARVVNISSRAGNLSSWSNKERIDLFRSSESTLTMEELDAQVAEYIEATGKKTHTKLGFPESVYGCGGPYAVSKAAEVALTRLHARSPAFLEKNITVNVCCPGWVQTDMTGGQSTKTAAEGADTAVWLATHPSLQGRSGEFFGERKAVSW